MIRKPAADGKLAAVFLHQMDSMRIPGIVRALVFGLIGIWLTFTLPFNITSTSAAGESPTRPTIPSPPAPPALPAPPADFPAFVVPGHEKEMQLLRSLYWLHYEPA